jgi:hypothetical protein
MVRLRRLYARLRSWRDWALAKIEYAQAESAKWRLAFSFIKAPYSLLMAMGFSPRMAASLIFVGGTVGGGVIAEATILAGPSFGRGDPGQYSAPLDAPVVYSDSNNTLRIDLGATPVGEIVIENVTVGAAYTGSVIPFGETQAVFIGGISTVTPPVTTYLEIGHLIIDRWRCDKLVLSEIDVHTLNVQFNASDGQSISPVPGTPRARGIGGGNRADSMETMGGLYDQIKIQAPTDGVNGKVDVMRLSNIFTKGAECRLTRIKAGTIDILYNEVGSGDGFDGKDFIIEGTVSYKNFINTDNVEIAIAPP